ncbi:MAG: Xylanase [Pedosphaera sp.]|nr:Xylanase [Pedosphaera sp.]
MKAFAIFRLLLVCFVALFPAISRAIEPSQVINLWPETAPGEKGNIGEEHNVTKPTGKMTANKPVVRIGNVSKPTISIFRPLATNDIGTTVLVFPGGAYNIIATDIEGTEVCQWLNSLGVTAVLLKYRVPRRAGLEKHVAPLQDAQRALSLVRHRATELKIDPKKIGVLGFSAGGHLAAALSTSAEKLTYTSVDAADTENCRPNFAMLIYPAYLTLTNNLEKLSPEVAVTTNHPPTFLAMTQDDPLHAENVLSYSLALKQAKVPVELHLYPSGGHGYGLRPTGNPVATWPDRAADWLRSRGLLSRR